MTTGKNHDTITCIVAPILGALTCTIDPTLAAEVMLGTLVGGLVFNPDLDLPQSRASQRWGWLWIVWIPYQKVISHRSFVSHCVGLGTLLRVLYLFLPLSGILTLLGLPIGEWVWSWGQDQVSNIQYLLRGGTVYSDYDSMARTKTVLAFLAGLEAGDIAHLLADGTLFGRWPKFKRLRKVWRFKR